MAALFPNKIKIVFTTTSLAPKPVINATDILQSANPNGYIFCESSKVE